MVVEKEMKKDDGKVVDMDDVKVGKRRGPKKQTGGGMMRLRGGKLGGRKVRGLGNKSAEKKKSADKEAKKLERKELVMALKMSRVEARKMKKEEEKACGIGGKWKKVRRTGEETSGAHGASRRRGGSNGLGGGSGPFGPSERSGSPKRFKSTNPKPMKVKRDPSASQIEGGSSGASRRRVQHFGASGAGSRRQGMRYPGSLRARKAFSETSGKSKSLRRSHSSDPIPLNTRRVRSQSGSTKSGKATKHPRLINSRREAKNSEEPAGRSLKLKKTPEEKLARKIARQEKRDAKNLTKSAGGILKFKKSPEEKLAKKMARQEKRDARKSTESHVTGTINPTDQKLERKAAKEAAKNPIRPKIRVGKLWKAPKAIKSMRLAAQRR